MDFRLVQFPNAHESICATLSGMVTVFNPEHPLNVSRGIILILDGILIDVNALQSVKAAVPIVWTLSGMLTMLKLTHPSKAFNPIDVIEVGSNTLVRAEH